MKVDHQNGTLKLKTEKILNGDKEAARRRLEKSAKALRAVLYKTAVNLGHFWLPFFLYRVVA